MQIPSGHPGLISNLFEVLVSLAPVFAAVLSKEETKEIESEAELAPAHAGDEPDSPPGQKHTHTRAPARWLPFLVAVVLGAATLLLWHALTFETAEHARSELPELALGLGLLMTLLTSVTVHLAQRARQRASQFQTVNTILEAEISRRKEVEQARAMLSGVIEASTDFIATADPHGLVTYINPAGKKMLGLEEDGHGLRIEDLHPRWAADVLAGEALPMAVMAGAWRGETALRHRAGQEIPASQVVLAHRGPDGNVAFFSTVVRDISDRKRAESGFRAHARQQRALAEFGEQALAGAELQQLMDCAVTLISTTLELEYCKALELLPSGQELVLRAGVGWRKGLTGTAVVSAGRDSQAGYTLLSSKPVVVEDLRTETRFSGPPLLHEHGVVSGMSVIIPTQGRPYGVLGAHTTRRRDFAHDDVLFLQSMANLLALAIDRKRAEENLRDSRQRLALHVQQTPLAVIEWNLNFEVTEWNPRAESLFGFTRAEALGQHSSFIVPKAARAEVDQVWMELLGRKGGLRSTNENVTKGGRRIFCEWYNTPLVDASGRVIAVASLVEDVTDRRQTETQLRQTSLYARSLLEASLDPLVTIRKDGRIMDVNEATELATGLSRAELIGTDFCEYFTEPEKAREGYQQVFARGLVRDYPLAIRHTSGQVTEVMYNAAVFKNEAGEIEGVFAAARDITERKKAERALERYAAELERSNAELADFAAVASHDLQEPLRKVMTFGERLNQHSASQLDAQGRDFLERMCNAARRMSDLIDALLQYSRLNTRAQPFATVDLGAVTRDVLNDLEARIQDSRAELEIGPMPKVWGDSTQLRQLLQNLLGNALKFHRPDRVPRVRVSSRPGAQGGWEISIADNGVGFDEKYLDRIFRPFQRLHGRGEFAGSGMGLAICRKIVSRHGGTISAKSAPGQGSAFTVHLPAKAEEGRQ